MSSVGEGVAVDVGGWVGVRVGVNVAAAAGEAVAAGASGGEVGEGGLAGAAEVQLATNNTSAARPREDPVVELRRMADLLKERAF
jgi:hypothetical protein